MVGWHCGSRILNYLAKRWYKVWEGGEWGGFGELKIVELFRHFL